MPVTIADIDTKLVIKEEPDLSLDLAVPAEIEHSIAGSSAQYVPGSTIPLTVPWSDQRTLAGGTDTIVLTALANGNLPAKDFDGLKINAWKIKADKTNTQPIVVAPAASHGHNMFGDANGQITLGAEAEMMGKGVETLADVLKDVAASETLTFAGNAGNTETVTIDAKVYTFQTVLTDVDGNVLIGATADDTINNLIAAINLTDTGKGVIYAATMTLHPTATAAAGAGDTMDATAKTTGTGGDAIATTETMASGSWGDVTMGGGVDGRNMLTITSAQADAKYEIILGAG